MGRVRVCFTLTPVSEEKQQTDISRKKLLAFLGALNVALRSFRPRIFYAASRIRKRWALSKAVWLSWI